MYGANPSERETNLKKDVLNKILKISEENKWFQIDHPKNTNIP